MSKRKKLPLIIQSEMAECGLVCIAMILGYYNHHATLNDMRRHVQSTIKGITLYQLKKISEHFGFITNVLRIEIDQLSSLHLPCIMHWNMDHFVVIDEITSKGINIHDPSQGRRFVPFSKVSSYFTGIILELQPHKQLPYSRAAATPQYSYTLVKNFLKKHTKSIFGLIVISCLIQFCYILGVNFTQRSIDNSYLHMQLHMPILIFIAFFGTKLMEYAATGLRAIMINTTGTLINYEFGWAVMRHIMYLPISFFENRHVGDILSRFGVIERIRHTATEGMVEGLVDGLVSIIVFLMMCYLNLMMSIIVVIFSLLYFVSRVHYHHKAKQYQEEAVHSRSIVLSHFMETMRSIPSIKVFSKEERRISSWTTKYIKSLNGLTRASWHKSFYDSIMNLLFGFELSLTLCIGCTLVTKNKLSVGLLYAFLAYRLQFVSAISKLAEKFHDYKFLKLHLSRLDDVMAESNESQLSLKNCTICPDASFRALKLKNISFSYALYDKIIFSDVNLSIKKGECVAITGPSGCGKTTLLKIMMGLLTPTTGEVYFGDIGIYPQHVSCYRKKIAAVLQNDVLFSGTIIDNISFFDKNPDIDRVYRCATLAGIIGEINEFPMRFYTLIGDMGSALSGGQKQRLILARALYAEPQILFLDEATSHLDVIKEWEVNNSIRLLDITVIMIAHRQETIMMADRVIKI